MPTVYRFYQQPYPMYGVPFPHAHSQQVNTNLGNPNYSVPVENILQNPLQPLPNYQQVQPIPMYQHPYPKPHIPQKPLVTNSFLSSFKNKDGTINMNKMLDTAGLMLNAVSQVSSLIKGIGGVFKS